MYNLQRKTVKGHSQKSLNFLENCCNLRANLFTNTQLRIWEDQKRDKNTLIEHLNIHSSPQLPRIQKQQVRLFLSTSRSTDKARQHQMVTLPFTVQLPM